MLQCRQSRRGSSGIIAVGLTLALVAAACSSDDPSTETTDPTTVSGSSDPTDTDSGTSTGNDEATTTDASTDTAPPSSEPGPTPADDRAYYVLPPGNFGGLPTSEHSVDQIPLYDGLTPLRSNVTDTDLDELFVPQDFEPVGETVEEETGRDGTTILYDEFGVAHITGVTRDDLAFGAGWVTARDRGLLVELGRGPARAALADIPGVNAFELVTSAQTFVPSEATEQLVTDQVDLIIETYGEEGEEIVSDAQAYADGLTAYWQANDIDQSPATVNDVIAVTAFIGSIFGAGGGSEASNAEFLSSLQNALGDERGRQAWEDAMLFDDPEAPTTIDERFDYGILTGGDVTGSVVIDEGSVIDFDPTAQPDSPQADTETDAPMPAEGVLYPAAGPVPSRQASNFLIVDPEQSVNDTSLAVMGPQLGYYYPEIVQQIHLSGPGIEAQGAAVPGLSMYLLLGRTEDYAWSLTSANHDVRDVFAEVLCNPDGSDPSRESDHYEFEGECRPFEIFDAGTLGDQPISYPMSVHGAVIGTALSAGRPIALTRQRSTFGRDGLNLAALKSMTEGDADTPEAFWDASNKFGFTFNWGYANRSEVAFFSSGYLPVRAEGLDRRLPTLGTGEYEWQGFLERDEHPHAVGHPSGRLLNWNNQSAPGFMHGDGTMFGSVHRVELFDQFPDESELTDVVGIMNRAATEDTHSPVWPVVSEVLSGSDAPTPLAAEAVDLLDAWVADDAPRLDADSDGLFDSAGATVMDAVWEPIADAVMRPVFGELTEELDLDGLEGESYVDKDLRSLLGDEVEGPYALSYCGNGSLDDCRTALWQVVDDVSADLAATYGNDDPTTWLQEGELTSFVPGLIDNTMRRTNRPTFQQVLEFAAGPR